MEQTKENKMGVMPVNKLLVTMSLPIVISMLIQAMYNLVDSVFVAQINPDALTAVGYGVSDAEPYDSVSDGAWRRNECACITLSRTEEAL